MLEIDIASWCALAGLLVSLTVSLVTKSNASAAVKALTNLFLAALAGVFTAAAANTGDLQVAELVFGGVMTFVSSVVSYVAITKPTQVDAKIRSIAPEAGIGSNGDDYQAKHAA